MIERTSSVNRIYNGLTELHEYKTRVNPQTLKTEWEHLVCRIYTRTAHIEETDFQHRVDRPA